MQAALFAGTTVAAVNRTVAHISHWGQHRLSSWLTEDTHSLRSEHTASDDVWRYYYRLMRE